MAKAQFGMIGLGTMGRNFLLNVAEHGISGIGYDLDGAKRELLLTEGAGMDVVAAAAVPEFVAGLDSPRKIMLLVPAGPIVDSVINELLPHLGLGDIVIDGGNSHFVDTERREKFLAESGFEFLGVGVSGGEEGARHGASIMVGGNPAVYEHVRPIFEAASAKVDGEPCAAHVGSGSAGHFVKMVHNGIEYGLMQILAETYDFMHRVLKMDYRQMSDTFAAWNDTELNSFLVEITADVLRKVDAETGKPLVEVVLDKAAQKGTGKWTSQAAMDLGVPIPTIDAAVSMRQISAQKEVRELVAAQYGRPTHDAPTEGPEGAEAVESVPQFGQKAQRARADVKTVVSEQHREAVDAVPMQKPARREGETPTAESKNLEESLTSLKNALLCAFISTYTQGMSLLQTASVEKEYGADLAEIAKIWRGGCIIRSALLEEMRQAYSKDPNLPSLLLDDKFAAIIESNREDWRKINDDFAGNRVPALCFTSSMNYFSAFGSVRLPANLIQAQRDFFGAHTYQRVDKEGVFHTPDWVESNKAGQ